MGEGLARYVAWQNGLRSPEDHAREIFVESPLCQPSVTFRKAAVEAVGGYRERGWPEDWDLWLRLVAAGHGIAKVDHLGLLWRHHAGRMTFSDPRCAPPRVAAARAHHLAAWLRRDGRPLCLWGAGKAARVLGRDLAREGIDASVVVDIDPRKVGGARRGVPIVSPEALPLRTHVVVVAVGARDARPALRARLGRLGLVEGSDFVFAA